MLSLSAPSPRVLVPALWTACLLLGLLGGPAPGSAEEVRAGIDLLTTGADAAVVPLSVPAGFFDTGSQAFGETVRLSGKPLDQLAGDPIGSTDTIVHRLEDATDLYCGNRKTIDLELVALRLAGTIEVSYPNSAREIWDVEVCRSATESNIGTMTIEHTCEEGGVFSSSLTVAPRILFIRHSDGLQRILDPGDAVTLSAAGSWVHDPRGQARVVGAGVRVDGDCDGTIDAALPGTSNFFPGFFAGVCDTCPPEPSPGTAPPPQSPLPPVTPEPVPHTALDHEHTVGTTPAPPCTVEQDFEGGATGWSNDAASTCTTGSFVLGTPTQTINAGVTTQVGGDHTTGGGNALFTATNSSTGVDDVDGGVCILDSPVWNVAEASTLSVWYFHGQRDAGGDPGGDFFVLEVSTDGGASFSPLSSGGTVTSGGFVPLVSEGDVTSHAVWTQSTTAIPAGSSVRLRLRVADGTSTGDLVEGGIDDVSICPAP